MQITWLKTEFHAVAITQQAEAERAESRGNAYHYQAKDNSIDFDAWLNSQSTTSMTTRAAPDGFMRETREGATPEIIERLTSLPAEYDNFSSDDFYYLQVKTKKHGTFEFYTRIDQQPKRDTKNRCLVPGRYIQRSGNTVVLTIQHNRKDPPKKLSIRFSTPATAREFVQAMQILPTIEQEQKAESQISIQSELE